MAKYYWLKMRRDFFKRHDLQILENLPDGKELVLFYVKLLVESVDHGGALRYSETKPYTPEMLATITNTTPEFAAQALEILADLDFIKDDTDGTILLPYAVKLIDSAEDNYNAQKQARYRERKRAEVTQSNAEVTRVTEMLPSVTVTKSNAEVTSGNNAVTKNNKSIDIETDIEIDIDKEKCKRENATKKFVAPSHDQVLDYMTTYCFEKSLNANPVVEAEKFFNYYTANGWRVGRNKMRDFKAAARNWLSNVKEYSRPDPTTNPFTDVLGGEF